MSFFQESVEIKYENDLDPQVVEEKYAVYYNHFGNPIIYQNIRESKEEEYQEGFVRHLFVNILGYTLKSTPIYNLVQEQKNVGDSKKADGREFIEVIRISKIQLNLSDELE